MAIFENSISNFFFYSTNVSNLSCYFLCSLLGFKFTPKNSLSFMCYARSALLRLVSLANCAWRSSCVRNTYVRSREHRDDGGISNIPFRLGVFEADINLLVNLLLFQPVVVLIFCALWVSPAPPSLLRSTPSINSTRTVPCPIALFSLAEQYFQIVISS